MSRIDEISERLSQATGVEIVPGYIVTRNGLVYSVKSNWRGYGTRALTPGLDRDGYLRVRLTVDGRRRAYRVHQLVAAGFLPSRLSGKHEIRHLDGSRTNNIDTNLKWGTRKENAEDRNAHGTAATGDRNGMRCHPESVRRGERHPSVRLTDELVRSMRQEHTKGATFTYLAKLYGVSNTVVAKIIKRLSWRHVE